MPDNPAPRSGRPAGALALVGALGVVFGDIGTSPLYAMDAVRATQGSVSEQEILGATSTLIWLLVVIVSLLYVRLLLREDNHGEGGLLALLVLVRARTRRPRLVGALTILAIVGASAFLGDSLITPAISVLSAVEGMEQIAPSLASAVVPTAVAILLALFLLQPRGTGLIGRLFGPVMAVWFATIGLLGAFAIARHPGVLVALSPHVAVQYFLHQPVPAFLSLGGVVLAVTGAEALYADLGHFGRRAIARAWTFLVLPALTLAYLGQAAELVATPGARSFFTIVPGWATVPVVLLSTVATIIASQAVISGTFTVVHRASRLGLLPDTRPTPRSDDPLRPYLPWVNWTLAVGVLLLVLAFQASAALAAAYGLAVTATISVTATLLVVRLVEQRRPAVAALAGGALLVALALVAANAPKALTGGWLPVGVGLILTLVMTTWWRGQQRLRDVMGAFEPDLATVTARLARPEPPVSRPPGLTVYLADSDEAMPLALLTHLDRESALQQRVVVLSWRTLDRPTLGRATVSVGTAAAEHGIYLVVGDIGYDDHPQPRALLELARRDSSLGWLRPDEATYVVSQPLLMVSKDASMPRWRQRLFLLVDRLSGHPGDVLDLPDAATMIVGRRVHL